MPQGAKVMNRHFMKEYTIANKHKNILKFNQCNLKQCRTYTKHQKINIFRRQFTNANSMPSVMPSTKSSELTALEVLGGEFVTWLAKERHGKFTLEILAESINILNHSLFLLSSQDTKSNPLAKP